MPRTTAPTQRLAATAASHIAAVACGAAGAAAFFLSEKIRHGDQTQENEPSLRIRTPSPPHHQTSNAQASAVSTMAASPTLPIAVFRPHPDMEIAFDARTRNPCYVVERLPARHERVVTALAPSDGSSSHQSTGSDSKKEEKVTRQSMHFHEEKMLPEHHRSRNSYYKHSGFDRGHLIPSSDFAGNPDAMKSTFNLCNISPQNPTFNRKVWGRLEALIRNVAREEFEGKGRSTYVCTGPLWLPASVENKSEVNKKPLYRYSHLAIGQPPSLVQVPTHFFKVVAVVDENEKEGSKSTAKVAAFVLPNENLTARRKNVDLQSYLVRLSDLEAVSGMSFFPNYLGIAGTTKQIDDLGEFDLRSLADALTEDLWDRSPSGKNAAIVPTTSGSLANTRPTVASTRRRKRIIKAGKKLGVPMEHLCDLGRCSVVVKAIK